MKISISYPPLPSAKGTPLLSQNRQFQYFSEPTYIYPVVPAYAATLLSQAGYEVVWDDGIAEEKSYEEWLKGVEKARPDLMMIETKTPVVKRHWRIIDEVKEVSPETRVVLVGDHVTALPRESMENSKVDYVIEGGDYDFLLLNLVRCLDGEEKLLEPGFWYREGEHVRSTGRFELNHNLDALPYIDRDLTKWRLYAYKNGNFKATPGTYLMVARDCWWRRQGGCTFCLTPDVKVFTENGFTEIERIVNKISTSNGAELTVLTHNSNFKRVTQVFKHWYEGEILEIRPYYIGEPIKLTPYHKVYALKKENLKRCSKRSCWSYYCIPKRVSKRINCNNCSRQYYRNYEPNFIKAEKLNKGDYLIIPILNDVKDIEAFEPCSIFPNLEIVSIKNGKMKLKGSKYDIPTKIPLSKEFLRLIGYYLAEGHVTKASNRLNSYYVGFTFSQKEENLAEDVVKIFKNIFNIELKKTLNKKNKTVQLYLGCNIIARLFMELFGSNSYNKKLPNSFIFLSTEKQKELIISLFKGDAHLRKRSKNGGSEYVFETASERLARQIFIMLTRLNIIPSFSIKNTKKWKHKVPIYKITLSSLDIIKIFEEELPKANRRFKHGFILNNHIFVPIKNIEYKGYKGYVYNLSVEDDQSYAANFIAVKNCSWPILYPNYRVMSVKRALNEVGFLIERYKVKEIFDDTGTFPAGVWLREFCKGMIERGYNEKIYFSCNARFGVLKPEDYKLMKRAGFRMLLFGLESANQETLNRLNKGITIRDIIDGCRWAREAGLEPHITIMVGYPWETREDAMKTLRLAKILMEKGWAVTLQSTIVMPYPGTKMYEEALKNGWFRVDPKDYDRFDMSEPILKTLGMGAEEVVKLCDSIYKIFLSPKYVLKHLLRIRSLRDLRFTIRGFLKVLGHVKDFAKD